MKKMLSVFLPFCLLLLVCSAVAENADDVSKNLLPLWNFEQGEVTQEGYYEFGCKIVEGGALDTAHSLRIRGVNSGNGQPLTGLKEDADYQVTVYAKVANKDGGAWPSFGVNGYDGTGAYVAVDGNSASYFNEDWAEYTLQFHTAVGYTSALIYTWTFGEGEVDFYIDELCITEMSVEANAMPQTNETFELETEAAAVLVGDNLLSLWDFEQGDVFQDGYYEFGCKIVEGGALDTAHSMRIRSVNSGNGQPLLGLKEDTDYQVTVYAKAANREAGAWPTFGVNAFDNSGAYVAVDGTDSHVYFTEDWAEYTLRFHTGAGWTSAMVYTWTFGEGEVDFFIDEVSVYEIAK